MWHCRYATFEQDVDVVVEDLTERLEHMRELTRDAEKYGTYNEELNMPEVRNVRSVEMHGPFHHTMGDMHKHFCHRVFG